MLDEYTAHLLEAADQYQVPELAVLCERYNSSNFTIEFTIERIQGVKGRKSENMAGYIYT